MTDDRTLDRRSFLGRASTAGLVGFAGVGGLRSRARQDSDGEGIEESATGDAGRPEGDGQDGHSGDSGIDYFQIVFPVGNVLGDRLVNRIVVVGRPIRPGVRPPPQCFPQSDDQWFARDAVVVDPTTTTGLFGDEDELGAVNRTRAHLDRQVEPGTVYRITGGDYCDGNALVTVHELPPRLSEEFSTEMLDRLDDFLEDAGSRTVGNGTAPNATDEPRD